MTLSACPPQLSSEIYRKLGTDASPLALKNDFLAACEECDCEFESQESHPAAVSIERTFKAFVRTKTHFGDPIVVKNGEIVAHVRNLDDTTKFLQSRINMDRSDIANYFRWLTNSGGSVATPSQRKEAQEWFDDFRARTDPITGDWYRISSPVCWVARDEVNANASYLLQHDVTCLPCRLGLPEFLNSDSTYVTGLNFIGFLVAGDHLENARCATFCHGSYVTVRDIWEPGGFTRPIPYGPKSCVGKGGVSEMVCLAPSYGAVESEIYVFNN